jgi:hypothetical protein
VGALAFWLSSGLLLASLQESDDRWRAPVLERALGLQIAALGGFPSPLFPPDLEREIAESLEELVRLDSESAASWSRSLLSVLSSDCELTWTARRVLAASGDLETVRLGLRSYFQAPPRWREVLAAGADPRLRDFDGGEKVAPPSERLFLTTLERNLARARERQSIRALLAWARASKDPSSPRRVLEALPPGIPFEAEVRDWLRRVPSPAETLEIFRGSESRAEIEGRLVALSSEERPLALRWLAERDQEALAFVSVSREEIDRLHPYFARSRHRAIRDSVRRAEKARGRALASLLLSGNADDDERREALHAMPDAWAGAIVSGGGPIFEILSRLLPREELERFLAEAELDQSLLAALAIVALPSARLRLEALGTPEAVEGLMQRSDRVLAVPALFRLRREGEPRAARAAALALVSLGGPGSDAWLRAELATSAHLPQALEALEAMMRSPIGHPMAIDLVRRLGSTDSPSPSVFAALLRLPLVELSSPASGAFAERVHRAMSLSGERKYLPLLIDLATGSLPEASAASREAAFSALAGADLGPFAFRLHRLAGDPDREVRLRAAAALVPGGEAWTVRLLVANVDSASRRDCAIARSAVRRIPKERAREVVGEMVGDGTAGSFGVLLYLELAEESETRGNRLLQEKLWRAVADDARGGKESALLAASRLTHREAVAVVTRRLSAR